MRSMHSEQPPVRLIRSGKIAVVIYGFRDASVAGFGSTLKLPDGCTFFRHGLWGRDADDVSLNFRELSNLVDTIEEGVGSGELLNAELFIFTDNSTAEGAYYKGNGNSRLLFALVLCLHILDMHGMFKLHLIHVAGTCMIMQGTDGLS